VRDGTSLLIDLERLDTFDNLTVATIVGLVRFGRRVGTEVRVEGVRSALRESAERLQVDALIGTNG
jgi:anti-anti-sigma regulatory factor